jgi:hypothetical protein
MADEPDSLVLHLLGRMDDKLTRLADDMHDVKVRLTAIEEGVAGVNRRIDRAEARLDRIEKRPELADAPRKRMFELCVSTAQSCACRLHMLSFGRSVSAFCNPLKWQAADRIRPKRKNAGAVNMSGSPL